MNKDTQIALQRMEEAQKTMLGTETLSIEANPTPSVGQKMVDKIQLHSDFLTKINAHSVDEPKGQTIALGATGMIARTVNIANTDRTPRNLWTLEGRNYEVNDTFYDSAIPFKVLDQWAKFPDFNARYQNAVTRLAATNRLMIGFNGVSSVANSDPSANPLGQDVNQGWLKSIEADASERYITEGKETGKITIGTTGDYRNLDALVHDAKQLLDDEYEEGDGIIAIIGSELLANAQGTFYTAQGDNPSQKQAIENRQVIGTYGGLSAIKVPYFPKNAVLVTALNNLSIYTQTNAVRRKQEANHKRNQYENYWMLPEDYIVEQYGQCGVMTNIEYEAALPKSD